MRKLLGIAGLAILWAISGWVIGAALDTVHFDAFLGGLPYPLALIGMVVNMLLGFALLVYVMHDPLAWRAFSDPASRDAADERSRLFVGCLFVLPISLIMGGLVMWLFAQILRSTSR